MKLAIHLSFLFVFLFASANLNSSYGSAWQVYTPANGLIDWPSVVIEPDEQAGMWLGHESGGQGVYHKGGLVHLRSDGSFRQYTNEAFASCSSVDDLAVAPDKTLWVRLSGVHNYGATDHLQDCGKHYGRSDETQRFSFALGYIDPQGRAHMLPQAELPQGIALGASSESWGFDVDRFGRVWLGSSQGAVVRTSAGTWREIGVWNENTIALSIDERGERVLLASEAGSLAVVTIKDQASEVIEFLASPEPGLTVNTVVWGPSGANVVATQRLYQQSTNGWTSLDLAFKVLGSGRYGPSISYNGDELWLGDALLWRLTSSGWQQLRPENTPLPRGLISDLASANGSLLIATTQGVARYSPSSPQFDLAQAQQAFDRLWQQTNQTEQAAERIWGPQAWAETYEALHSQQGSYRFVRYYDKARMELNDPAADPQSAWYVTNGLLVRELVEGRAQLAQDVQKSLCPYDVANSDDERACPASIPVAGDLDIYTDQITPSYRDFQPYLSPVDQRLNSTVSTILRFDPQRFELSEQEDKRLASDQTRFVWYDPITQHHIPAVFMNYLKSQPIDWLYSFGRPISEPYWVEVRIQGEVRTVLVQLYERRTLTYSPQNAPAWQVEMGNVGQHYYLWRYRALDRPPWQE